MSYRSEMHRLAEAVSSLLTDGATVPGDDLRVALAGHLSLVQLLDTVHADLAPNRFAAVRPDIEALERDPVALLGHLLAKHPRHMDQPLTEILSVPIASDAGQRWRVVATTATVAEQHWQMADRSLRPTGAGAWSEMADVAALSQAVAVLDLRIADSLNAAARWKEAAGYRSAGLSGLRLAAFETRALAGSGPLPAAMDLQPGARRKVIPVRSMADIAPALTRLGHLAATSDVVSPGHVELAAQVVVDASLNAARALDALPGGASPVLLRQNADRLAELIGSSRRVVSPLPGDGLVLEQAQEIHRMLAGLKPRNQTLPGAHADAVTSAAYAATRDLNTAATKQLDNGNWLIRAERAVDWIRPKGSWEYPQIHQTLAAASAALGAAPEPIVAKSHYPAPHRTLVLPLAQALSPARPAKPHIPRHARPRPQ